MRSVSRCWDYAAFNVLVVDPDSRAYRELQEVCKHLGATPTACDNGADSLFLAGHLTPDVVVISAELPPVLSCPEVVTALRRHTAVPIIVGMGKQAESAASAVAAGGSRILNRPYERGQIQPILSALLVHAQARVHQEARISVGSLELDSLAYEVRASGKPLTLTLKEFELLRLLMLHPGRVVTPEQIREEVWGSREDNPTGNTIAVHIRRIRSRLGGSVRIISVRGVGYRLSLAEEVREHTPVGG